MATEKGVIFKTGINTAWVRTEKTEACETCSAKHGCHTMGGGKEMEVEAINDIGAKEGDRVVMSFETASLIKLSFLVYIFPILAIIVGAVVGQSLAPNYGFDPVAFSIIVGLVFFLAAFFLIRSIGNRISVDDKYRPRIVRIDYAARRAEKCEVEPADASAAQGDTP